MYYVVLKFEIQNVNPLVFFVAKFYCRRRS